MTVPAPCHSASPAPGPLPRAHRARAGEEEPEGSGITWMGGVGGQLGLTGKPRELSFILQRSNVPRRGQTEGTALLQPAHPMEGTGKQREVHMARDTAGAGCQLPARVGKDSAALGRAQPTQHRAGTVPSLASYCSPLPSLTYLSTLQSHRLCQCRWLLIEIPQTSPHQRSPSVSFVWEGIVFLLQL